MPDHRPRRIAYIPFTDVNNAYVSRMHEVLRGLGSVEQFMRPRQFLRELMSWKMRRYDATVFNWIENDFLEKGTGRIKTSNVLKVLVKTCVARALSRRLVFVRHNIYPHSLQPGQEGRAKTLIDWYERWFDVALIHSGAHLEGSRYRYCPHPLYKHAAADGAVTEDPFPELPSAYFVMFGRIAPYKRILETARDFPADKNLLIIGSLDGAAYGQELAELRRANVFYRPGYLSESVAQHLIRRSDGIVLAHAGENTVVSGSFFYAMSLPVPVLAVETPFLRWVQPQVGEDLLTLAPDIEGLMRLAGGRVLPSRPDAVSERLQRAFGDEAIAAVWRSAIGAP